MLIPGKIVKKFISKKGKEIVIRYPKWEDLDEFTRYINKLSQEDTLIIFSGEEIKKEEEAKTLSQWFYQMEIGDKVVLGCFYGNKLVAVANVDRDFSDLKRSRHVGIFGISVEKEFRGEGVGYELGKAIIEEVKKEDQGIKNGDFGCVFIKRQSSKSLSKIRFQRSRPPSKKNPLPRFLY